MLPATGSARQPEISRLSVECHRTYDRLVIRSRGGTPNTDVRYVARIHEDASGRLIPLLGTARLQVMLQIARAHTLAGRPLLPAVLTPRCPSLRQVKLAGDFEGYVSLGLGLRGAPASASSRRRRRGASSSTSHTEPRMSRMDLSTLDLDALLDQLRATNPDGEAERMVRAFEEVLRLVRDDQELLSALLAAAVALSAVVEDSSPRTVLEQWFRRSVPDEIWRERYLPLFD